MGKCNFDICSTTWDYICCFDCSESRFEECQGKGYICPIIANGTVDRESYVQCQHFKED